MRRLLPRATAAVAALATTASLAIGWSGAADAATPGLTITEWMYSPAGSSGEFVEITNLGDSPVDLAGWSFDDDSRTAGTVALDGLGTLAAGDGGEDVADWTDVHINEVSSDNDDTPVGDAIELYNSGGADVDIAGWLQIDSGAASGAKTFQAKLPDGSDTSTIPAHGYVYFASTKGLGSGGDGVNLYLPDGPDGTAGTLVDSVEYTAGEAGGDEGNDFGAGAFARCPDGSGDFVSVAEKTFGASNAGACDSPLTNPDDGQSPALDCQPEAPEGTGTLPDSALAPGAWPGSPAVTVADQQCAWMTSTGPEGRDISGLVFDPADSGVLYAVKNKSWIFRLVKSDGLWVPDTSNGWGEGKQIFFPGSSDTSTNQPDTEGLTVGSDGALYVTTERNNQANNVPLNSVLRFDPTSSSDQLVATEQWDLTAEFPELHAGNKTEANLGFEGITFVPDSYLTDHGFVDDSKGRTYRPGDYPRHGDGLYFAALENDGKLYAYALNDDGTFHRVSVVDTGMGHAMDVQYDADTQRIWALCDNTCGVVSTVLKIGPTGTFVPDVAYRKPADLPNVNIEGFALAPNSTCVDGSKDVLWSDDGIWAGGTEEPGYGHALYSGRIRCDLGWGDQGVPAPTEPQEPGDADTKDAIKVLPDATFVVGETIRVEIGAAHAGTDVAAWLFSEPLRLGSFTVAADGIITMKVPASAPTGQHRLAIYGAEGELIGWQNVTVLPAGAGGLDQGGSGLGSGGAQLPAAGASLSGYLAPVALIMVLLGLTVVVSAARDGRGRG